MGGLLNSKKSLLSSRISNFDTSYVITSTEFAKYLPSFVTPPFVSDFTYQSATIITRFNNYGFLYACAVKSDAGFTNNTTPYQISNGLDHKNRGVPNATIEITQTYQYFNLTVENLEPKTAYSIFVTGGNSHPGWPDL